MRSIFLLFLVVFMLSTKAQIDKLCSPPQGQGHYAMPHGLEGYFHYPEGLKCSQISEKPYLCYFTGFGDVESISFMAEVLSDSAVLKILKEQFVFAMLFTDEQRKLPVSERFYSEIKHDTIYTYGERERYYQLKTFGQSEATMIYIIGHDELLLTHPYEMEKDVNLFKSYIESVLN